MPNPPKYNFKNLNSGNEFLCVRGSETSVYRRDLDNKPSNRTLNAYYSQSQTNVPIEILNTGNIEVLEKYCEKNKNTLRPNEINHLRERIDVMRYFNELSNYYRTNERKSVGKMELNNKGQLVFPGVFLDRRQDTTLGCWSCAFSMLLKGRGVDVDQKLLRRFRPEFEEGNELKDAKQTDIINSNMMSEIYQYSSLVDKICPNTKICKMDKSSLGSTEADIKKQVFKALREKNAPVAFCNGYHWTTIVGLNKEGTKFYVVDSQVSVPGHIREVDVNTYLGDYNAEFVWMEDIVLEKDGKSPQLPENEYTVDPATGSIIPKYTDSFDQSSNLMSTGGSSIMDRTGFIEYYVPSMIRDYSKPYEEQKEASDKYLAEKGILPPAPNAPTYTNVSANNLANVRAKLETHIKTFLFSDRKTFLKEQHGFTQDQIDKLTRDEADKLYEEYKDKPPVNGPKNNTGKSKVVQPDSKKENTQPPQNSKMTAFARGEYQGDYVDDDLMEAIINSLNDQSAGIPENNPPEFEDINKPYEPEIIDINAPYIPSDEPSTELPRNEEPSNKIPSNNEPSSKVPSNNGPSGKILTDNELAREIAEQRVIAYEQKIQVARKRNLSPAKTEMLEDIAASEYELGSIADAYKKAPESQKALYKESFASSMGLYLARVVISKKLEKIDSVLDANAEKLLTSDAQVKNFAKALSSTYALSNMTTNILKNPDDAYFLNSEDIFNEFVTEQQIVNESMKEQKTKTKEEEKTKVNEEEKKESIVEPQARSMTF